MIEEKEERKTKSKKIKALIYIGIFLLGISITCIVLYFFRGSIFGEGASNGICYTACQNKVTISEDGISDAVEKVYDAVVLIQNYQKGEIYSTGTGVVYKIDSEKGYIMTNYHVVTGNDSIKIILSNDKEVTATYVGGDEYLDIAILTIPKSNIIKVAELGESTSSELGDTVFTVGTPIDYEYRGTVTRGILSGKDRLVSVSVSGDAEDYVMKVLQTDAAINPGNSGGPLVNSNGEVIGINSLKLVEDEIEGMGFAIPIEDILIHIDTLEAGKTIKRPFLGISMLNVTDTYSLDHSNISIDSSIKSGVVVVSIINNSSVSGILKKGDTITKINDQKIETAAYLRYELYKNSVGDKIKITYIRGKETKTINVTLKAES